MSAPTVKDSPFDYDELLARCAGQPALVKRALSTFQGTLSEDLLHLQHACETNDVEEVQRLAHRIKGASANASAKLLHKAGLELELCCKFDPASITRMLQRVQCEAENLTNYLASQSLV
ncbi:MAG: Hpt domain-containing protein [Planctomycetales bacterium]|nr:Hpt domain-containing protein [Planctomycetales bacterium]